MGYSIDPSYYLLLSYEFMLFKLFKLDYKDYDILAARGFYSD